MHAQPRQTVGVKDRLVDTVQIAAGMGAGSRHLIGMGSGVGITEAPCIRRYGGMNEGVSFAILLMNILSPYIENWTKPKALGKRGSKA